MRHGERSASECGFGAMLMKASGLVAIGSTTTEDEGRRKMRLVMKIG